MEAFSIPKAEISPISIGSFIGDTRKGGSVNCEVIKLCAHGNTTHTECVGHITKKRISISDIISLLPPHLLCLVITITPETLEQCSDVYHGKNNMQDNVISRRQLEAQIAPFLQTTGRVSAIIVRTKIPSNEERAQMIWSGTNPPYFTFSAMQYLREIHCDHLLVDLPSVDREDDGGIMNAHKAFFGLLDETDDTSLSQTKQRTITELCNVSDTVLDGIYILNLQIISLGSDAAPSRPIIFPVSISSLNPQKQ